MGPTRRITGTRWPPQPPPACCSHRPTILPLPSCEPQPSRHRQVAKSCRTTRRPASSVRYSIRRPSTRRRSHRLPTSRAISRRLATRRASRRPNSRRAMARQRTLKQWSLRLDHRPASKATSNRSHHQTATLTTTIRAGLSLPEAPPQLRAPTSGMHPTIRRQTLRRLRKMMLCEARTNNNNNNNDYNSSPKITARSTIRSPYIARL